MDSGTTLPLRQSVLERLMRQTAEGDWKAFSMLYAMTSSRMFGLILRMTRYSDSGEDLLQEVYLTIWNRAGDYQPNRAQVMTWITTITRNRTLDWLRSQGAGMRGKTVNSPDSLDLAATDEDPEQFAEARGSNDALDQCLESLSDDQRQAIVLSYIDGHSHAELSERLSTPLGTVKSWVRRGLDRLKACLTRERTT